ncbi:MAG: hypothetical protein Q7R39_13105 [Dehalococcoidia bacterium]|nr:hypothetical protein [Dehalococcoidia bacterium]
MTLELVNVVFVALTFFAVAAYAGLTYATLRELSTEHKSTYDSYVAVGDSANAEWRLEVTCLGPGPAQRIDIRAHLKWIDEVSWPGKGEGCLLATVWGLPVGHMAPVTLQGDEEYHVNLSEHVGRCEVAIEVDVLTVLGKHMPLARFKVPYDPSQPPV